MTERRRGKARTVGARERARRLGWRVDPPRHAGDGPADGGPTGARRKRTPRDATTNREVWS
jgi:hypothetical protein